MGKIIECATVDPSSGCAHVVRGTTEADVLKNAMEHAKQHGIREATPELMAKVPKLMAKVPKLMAKVPKLMAKVKEEIRDEK